MDEPSLHTHILREGGRATGIRRKLLRVVVKSGPDKGKESDHAEERIVIGSHPRCDVVLTDPTVSRQHAEVVLVPGGYLVRDLDSTNGVMLDHVRVHSIVIKRDTVLNLGSTRVTLKLLDATVEVPVAAETRFGPLLGQSVGMRRVFERLRALAPSELSVLITGESGTGKELAARALHDASPRRNGPLQIVDCGAISGSLIESELFGHRRGAFTGAMQNRTGAFVAASGGTIFLDEIGELPLELQPRLLGAIERKQVTPVGDTRPVAVDVRIVAATHRDLRRAVNRGTFREDLYFRIAGSIVELPPLRTRHEDIPLYVDDFFEGRVTLDAQTLKRLEAQPWPGNVRELRNALERASVEGLEEPTETTHSNEPLADLTTPVDLGIPYKIAKAQLGDAFDRRYVPALLARHDNNITRAAKAAELDRVHFLRMLDRLGLRPGRTHKE